MKLNAYTVVLLRRPADAPQLTGPLGGQPDQSLRGINVFRTSVEETRRLMSQDPSVQAGRLAVEVFNWYMPEGLLGDRPAAQITEE